MAEYDYSSCILVDVYLLMADQTSSGLKMPPRYLKEEPMAWYSTAWKLAKQPGEMIVILAVSRWIMHMVARNF